MKYLESNNDMPQKHVISHAMATFICAITVPLFVNSLNDYIPFIHETLQKIAAILYNELHVSYFVDIITSILFALLIAFIWGIGFLLFEPVINIG